MTAFLDFNGLSHFKDKMDMKNASTYVKTDSLDSILDNKLINVYTYKGTVPSFDQLPKSGNKAGDIYDVAGGMNYAWDGNKWDALGDNKVAVDAALSSTSVNPVQNKVIKDALDKKAGTAVASSSNNGLMSSKDKEKLDGMEPITNLKIDELFE